MAKNISGEVIDRKEVRFITVEAPSSAATTTQERTETTMTCRLRTERLRSGSAPRLPR